MCSGFNLKNTALNFKENGSSPRQLCGSDAVDPGPGGGQSKEIESLESQGQDGGVFEEDSFD